MIKTTLNSVIFRIRILMHYQLELLLLLKNLERLMPEKTEKLKLLKNNELLLFKLLLGFLFRKLIILFIYLNVEI